MEATLPQSSAMALGFPALERVSSLPSIAHLFGSTKKRCGIYLLAFQSGHFYVGQAVEVVRRFSQHRRNHSDIEGFSFVPVRMTDLDDRERAFIYRAETLGLKITNAVHVTSVVGDADLDLVVPVCEQDAWLRDPSHFAKASTDVTKIVLPEIQQGRFSKHFAKFEAHPLAATVLPLVQRYVDRCLPAPRRTEYSFWSVSCMPSTNQGSWPRLLSVNAGVMELFVAGWVKQRPADMWSFITVAEDVLLEAWPTVDALVDMYPFVEAERIGYRDAGQHQVTFHVRGSDETAKLLSDSSVVRAAAMLALRVMRKRATIYGKFHCPQLAAVVLGNSRPK